MQPVIRKGQEDKDRQQEDERTGEQPGKAVVGQEDSGRKRTGEQKHQQRHWEKKYFEVK